MCRLVQTVNGLLKVANWSSNLFYKFIVCTPFRSDLRFAGHSPGWFIDAIVAVITWGTTFPGVKDAPLREPLQSKKWRFVLFSHGAGCSRLMNVSGVCDLGEVCIAECCSRQFAGSWRRAGMSLQPSSTATAPVQVCG